MSVAIVKTDVPSLQEELDRKAFETLEWLCFSVEQGRITPEQFSTGVDTLFMTASGLLKKDFIDLVTEAQRLCPAEPHTLKRFFRTDDKRVMKAEWVVGGERVVVTSLLNDKQVVKDFETAKAALKWFATGMDLSMRANGYKEI